MTIDEAIKINTTALARGYTASLEGFDAATKLGIEALKAVKDNRRRWGNRSVELLPGEDSIEDKGLSNDRIQKVRESPLGKKPNYPQPPGDNHY